MNENEKMEIESDQNEKIPSRLRLAVRERDHHCQSVQMWFIFLFVRHKRIRELHIQPTVWNVSNWNNRIDIEMQSFWFYCFSFQTRNDSLKSIFICFKTYCNAFFNNSLRKKIESFNQSVNSNIIFKSIDFNFKLDFFPSTYFLPAMKGFNE